MRAEEDVDLEVRVVLVTLPDTARGIELARAVVDEGLAACGNVIPGVISVYRWQGAVQEEGEVLLILKTTRRQVEALQRRVVELHPYEVPEFLALPVRDGFPPYLRWVEGDGGEGA